MLFAWNLYPQEIDTTHFSKKYHHKKSIFETMPNKKGEIVFLGNSITEQGPWRELFQNNHIINRGIGGDTTDGVLFRLDEVTASHPNKIFLLIGTNDLRNGKTPEYIIQRITQITKRIRKDSPNAILYLQSVLPTYNRPERPVSSIAAINKGIQKLVDNHNVFYIDLFSHFANTNDKQQLYRKLSLDGLHLNGKGYLKWKNLIKKYVNEDNNRIDNIIRRLKNPSDNYVMVTAHRGDWRNAPENSLQSIKNSINMGVDIVEVDLQITKDSVIVLMHDKTIDRTTTGTGEVSNYTYNELQKVFLKNILGLKTRHKIPTLKEAQELAKGKIVLDLDIKKTMPFQKVANVLKATGTASQTIVRSYRPFEEAKSYYGASLESVIYIPGMSENLDYSNYFNEWENTVNPTFYAPKFKIDTAPLVSFLNNINDTQNGIWVHSISLGDASRTGYHDDNLAVTDPDAAWGWLIERGADIIQTDRPFLLLEYLRNRNLHE
jgi:glycerophosphoryl diester phosphodiesterase